LQTDAVSIGIVHIQLQGQLLSATKVDERKLPCTYTYISPCRYQQANNAAGNPNSSTGTSSSQPTKGGKRTTTCGPTEPHTTRNNSLGTFNMNEMIASLDALNRRVDLLVTKSAIDLTSVESRFDDLDAWKVQFKCILMQTMKEKIINANLKNSLMASKVAQVEAQMECMIQVVADKESLQTTMLNHVQQCQHLLSDQITSIDEQVDAFDSG
jgi:hypothetical protein